MATNNFTLIEQQSMSSHPAFVPFDNLLEWADTDKTLYPCVIARVILTSLSDLNCAADMIVSISRIKSLEELHDMCQSAIAVRCDLHHLCLH